MFNDSSQHNKKIALIYVFYTTCFGRSFFYLSGGTRNLAIQYATIFPMRYIVFDLETQELCGPQGVLAMNISVATVYDSETKKYTTVTVDEIDQLWPIIEKADALVGYNSNHFDIPLLDKYYPGDLTQMKSIDILDDIKISLGRRLRLDSIAQATLGTKKSANGIQAVRWWKEGNITDIKKYCEQDVKVTKDIFEYAMKNGHVKFKDGHRKKEIPLDIAHWEEKEDVAMTHSLLF
jgi:DEAD/DEAH box helicase domain-containing protein